MLSGAFRQKPLVKKSFTIVLLNEDWKDKSGGSVFVSVSCLTSLTKESEITIYHPHLSSHKAQKTLAIHLYS